MQVETNTDLNFLIIFLEEYLQNQNETFLNLLPNMKCFPVHLTRRLLTLTHINRHMCHANPVYRMNYN